MQYEALEHLAGFVKGLGLLVGIETNGYYPDKLKSLIDKGFVDKIFLDVKAPPDDKKAYQIITGKKDVRLVSVRFYYLLKPLPFGYEGEWDMIFILLG